jgi:hypothetical protein
MKHLLFCFALSSSACGSQAGQTFTTPLATLKGTISANALTDESKARIAIVWITDGVGNGLASVDLPVETSFPASYTLNITSPPPEKAMGSWKGAEDYARMHGFDPNMRWAVGDIIVYQDSNSDGQLNVAPSGENSPDQVVGIATGVQVFYVEGTPAGNNCGDGGYSCLGILPTVAGFSLVQEPGFRTPQPGDCSTDDASGHHDYPCEDIGTSDAKLLSFDTPVDIQLSGAPDLQRYACATYPGQNWSLEGDLAFPAANYTNAGGDFGAMIKGLCSGPQCYCTGTSCPLDLPPAEATVTCSADKSEYVYQVCANYAPACNQPYCYYGHGELAQLGANPTPPPHWPCQ